MAIVQLPTKGGGTDFQGNQQWGWYPGSIAGTYYVVITEFPDSITYVDKTTDYGATWTEVGSTTDVVSSISVAFAQGIIYIYGEFGPAQPMFSPQPVRVARFNTVGGADTFLSSLIPPSPIQGVRGLPLCIAAKVNGDLAVGYTGAVEFVGGNNRDRVYVAEYVSGVWDGGTLIPGQSGLGFAYSFWANQILIPASNRLVLIMGSENTLVSAGFLAYVITKPSGGTWKTLQTAASDLSESQDNSEWPIGLGCTFVDTTGGFGVVGATQFAIPYVGGGSNSDASGGLNGGPTANENYFIFSEADNPVIATGVADTTLAIVPLQPAYETIVGMTYDPLSGTLYYVWVTQLTKGRPAWSFETVTTSGEVVYVKNTGSGWSSPPVVLQSWAVPFVPSGVVPIVFNGTLGALFYVIDSTNFNNGDPVSERHWFTPFSAPAPAPVPGSGGRGFIRFTLNAFTGCLARDYILYELIDRTLLSCAKRPECFCFDERQWGEEAEEVPPMGPPYGAIDFNPAGQIALPLPGADTLIFSFRVPTGYDAIILGFYHSFTGTGFLEGSGDIVWRIRSDQRYLRDCGNMKVTMGSSRQLSTVQGGLQLWSNDFVEYLVNAPNTSGLLSVGNILAGCHGYFWPRL